MDDLKVKYETQKRNAKHRGIEFDLSFQEWKDIWDGKFHLRGKKAGQLGMLRNRDEGGYTVGNVRLGTPKENQQEAAVASLVKRAGIPKKTTEYINLPTSGSWLLRRYDVFKPYVEEDEEEYQ